MFYKNLKRLFHICLWVICVSEAHKIIFVVTDGTSALKCFNFSVSLSSSFHHIFPVAQDLSRQVLCRLSMSPPITQSCQSRALDTGHHPHHARTVTDWFRL